MELTPRQQEILNYLEARLRQTGVMPSTRELQAHFGFASQTAAVNHLRALERKGAIKRLAGKARALRLSARPVRSRGGEVGHAAMGIPIFGQISAGLGSPTEQSAEAEGSVELNLGSIGVRNRGRTFALRVSGDSMVNAHICNGDLVILEAREPRRGDVVAALIDGETTLKRFCFEDGHPVLKAENPAYPDLHPARELAIQGVMVALVRPTSA